MSKEELNVLLQKIKKGDELAFESLTKQYGPLLTSVAASFDQTARGEGQNGIFADLYQDLTIALFKAACSFDTDQDKVTFGNYAKRCLNNCAISFLRKARSAARREEKVKNSLKKEQKSATSFSGVPDGDGTSALNAAKSILSPYEYSVFVRYIDGVRVSEIAADQGQDAKSVSNAIFRSKAKIKKYYKDRNGK